MVALFLACAGSDPCIGRREVPLDEAEAELGIDAEAEHERVTSLHDVAWSAASWSIRFDLDVEEPSAHADGDSPECSPSWVAIGSDIVGSVEAAGYFTADFPVVGDGYVRYRTSGTEVWFAGSVQVDAGLETYLLERGYPMEQVDEIWLIQVGSPDSGELTLVLSPVGEETFDLLEGTWERIGP